MDPRVIAKVVAVAVAEKLATAGIAALSANDLAEDRELRRCDFAALGLSSVDWMDVATRIEDVLGVELPDEVLLDAENRTVSGWSGHLHALLASPTAGDTEVEL